MLPTRASGPLLESLSLPNFHIESDVNISMTRTLVFVTIIIVIKMFRISQINVPPVQFIFTTKMFRHF